MKVLSRPNDGPLTFKMREVCSLFQDNLIISHVAPWQARPNRLTGMHCLANRGFLLECGIRVTLVLIFLALSSVRTRYGFHIHGCTLGFQIFRNCWGTFSMSSTVIQATQASPCGSELSRIFLHAAVRSKEQDNPWHLESSLGLSEERRKGYKDGDIRGGLPSSRSTAAISWPAWSHHRAPLSSAPWAAGPGPGCCHREGLAGRTPLRSPPPRLAAPRSRR